MRLCLEVYLQRVIHFLVSLLFVILSFMTPSMATASAYNGYYHKNTGSDFSFYDAMATYGTPAIDGQIGDGEWNTSYSRQIYKYDRDDNRIRYMFEYDTANLYILIDVDDDKIWDDSPGEVWDTNQDDGVEIYIDPDSSRDALLTKSDRVVAFTVTGKKYRFDQGNNTGSTEWAGQEFAGTINKAVGIKGTVNNSSDTDTGYVVEVAIPWQHLGGSMPSKEYISLNIIVVEDDDGGPLTVQYDETRWDEPFEIDRYFKWFGDGLAGPSNYARVYLLPSADTVSPSSVNDISVIDVNPFSAVISFTAPGDNSTSGEAVKYHIRHSKSGPISAEDAWASATPFDNRFIPKIGGKQETLRITGLESGKLYYFAVRAEDAAGNLSPLSTSSPPSCTTPAAPSGYGKGKIYPSPSGRFFINEDGTTFMPVTEPAGITWLGIRDLYNLPLWDDTHKKLINWYESNESGQAKQYIESLSQKGVNLIRIFIEDLAFAHAGNPYAPSQGVSYLEFPANDTGSNYVQETLGFLDDFMSLCESYGIHITITPFDTYFYKDYWDYNPYNIINGGMLSYLDDFITDPKAIAAQKKRLQILYDVVKQHNNFFAWEIMNEWDNDTFASRNEGWEALRLEWIKNLLGYMRALDNDSMVFVSSVIWQPQFELKDFLLLGDYFDFVCFHNYAKSIKDPTASGDSVLSIRPSLDSKRIVQYMTGNCVDSRPVIDLEFSPISLDAYTSSYTLEDDEETFHNVIWSEFASGAGGMGLRWPGKPLEYKGPRLSDNMLNYQKNMADYFSQTRIPFKSLNSVPWERNITSGAGGSNVKVFASSNGEAGLIYLLNDTRISSATVYNPSVQIGGLEKDGEYIVELWDTRNQGQPITRNYLKSEAKTLSVTIPSFDKDYFVGFSVNSDNGNVPLSPPALSASVSGVHVDLSWTIPSGADGITLYYTPAVLNYNGTTLYYTYYIPSDLIYTWDSIDMGSMNMLSFDLFSGFDYYLALTAYNRSGSTSGYSNIERIKIP